MNIPYEAVEAASRASYPAWRRKAVQAGVDVPATFDELPPLIKLSFYDEIRPALEAAAPIIAGQMLKEVRVDLGPSTCSAEHRIAVSIPGHKYLEGH